MLNGKFKSFGEVESCRWKLKVVWGNRDLKAGPAKPGILERSFPWCLGGRGYCMLPNSSMSQRRHVALCICRLVACYSDIPFYGSPLQAACESNMRWKEKTDGGHMVAWACGVVKRKLRG